MSRVPLQHPLTRGFLRFDSIVSSAVFEAWDGLRRGGSAYSSFLYRFKLTGLKRVVVDIVDDLATFGTVAAFALLAFALPPFSDTGDVWNKNRKFAVTITDAAGEIIGRRGIRQDDAIPLDEIPDRVIEAVLATEDSRFFDHFGIDLVGTARALVENVKAEGVVQGGSSLSQQVAKNLFLSSEQTLRRKVNEAFLALWIEARLSKDEILKLYLDRSYLGGGAHGVEAAAQFYFGKSIRDVDLGEAAMLAGLFKAPSKFAPHINVDMARARANVVLYRMLDTGFITQGELVEARREPAQVVSEARLDSPGWFLDWAYRDTIDLLEKKGLDRDFVIEVKTTIDPRIQRESQRILNDILDTDAPPLNVSQAASVTMAPDGAVKAIVGGRDYEVSQFNRATDALRQPGSSFKPFVYLNALLKGFTPKTAIVDTPVSINGWSPRNYTGKYAGRTNMTTALAQSYNSVPVQLMLKTGGVKAIIETAHLAGLQGELERVISIPLGTSAVTLLDITTAYATFAASGRLARPYTILEIRRPNGDLLYARHNDRPQPVQAVPEDKIAELNFMMNAVVTSGTGRRAFLGFAPQAGKTGTNQGYRDAWYIGYTANNVTGVWVGNDDFSEMKKVTGGLLPAMAWKRIMEVAERGLQPIGLAGVPMDESYIQYALEHPPEPEFQVAALPPIDGAPPAPILAERAPAPNSGPTVIGPPRREQPPPKRARAKVREAALPTPETPDEDVVVVKPKKERGAVAGVLRDMFGLFDDDDNDQPPVRKTRKRKANASLELPDANLGGRSGEETARPKRNFNLKKRRGSDR